MDRPTDVWSLLERTSATSPGLPAIAMGSTRLGYGVLRASAANLAYTLRMEGVAAGDRVALIEPNTPAFLTWTFATAGAGVVLVPLNPHLSPAELAAVLLDSDPVLVVAHESHRGLVEATLARLDDAPRTVFTGVPPSVFEEAGEGRPRNAPLGLPLRTSRSNGFTPGRVPTDAVAQLYYTSGTTGAPKGVPLTHQNIVTHALAATSELDLAQDDVWGHIAPMYHLADAWASIAITAVGGTHAFLPRFDAREALYLIDAAGITITNLVPTMLRRMLREIPTFGEDGAGTFRGSSLRVLLSGGAPIAEATVDEVLRVFGCEYVQTYGLTETSPYLTLAILEPHHRQQSAQRQLARRARTGRAFETVELDVVDESGRPVPRDDRSVGEIVARGPSITPGYWRKPEETERAFRGRWFHTGDLATIDGEGWVNIVDRRKDMIVTGGENVYSIEVENALYSHPSVAECAAFGLPSDEWGEVVTAAVVARSPVETEELVAHCRERLARFKVPRRIEFVESLPKTGSGKIAKRELRASYDTLSQS